MVVDSEAEAGVPGNEPRMKTNYHECYVLVKKSIIFCFNVITSVF